MTERIKTSPIPCRLRQARKAKGWSLVKAAKEAKVPKMNLCRWEHGGTAPVQAAQKLSRLYKKPINWLWPEDPNNG